MRSLLDRISTALMVLAASAVAFIAVAIGYGVIARKFFPVAPTWVNDVTSYALLVITFAGGAYVSARDAHTRVDLFRERLSERGKRYATLAAYTVCFVSCLVLAVTAGIVTLDNFARDTRLIRTIEIPKWTVIAVVAAGAAMVALTYAVQIIDGLRRQTRTQTER